MSADDTGATADGWAMSADYSAGGVVVYERAASRRYNDEESPSAETQWIVTGAVSYAHAYASLWAELPNVFTFPSLRQALLDGVYAEEMRDDEFFTFRASYASHPKPTAGETEFEFDVSAQTERIYQSLATAAYAPSGKTAPNFGGAIGLADGQPSGTEPLTAFSTFMVTKYWTPNEITQAYQLALESLVGAVNSAVFYGRAAGTVRFLGSRGRQSGDKFPITYQFGFRPSVSSFVIDQITVPSAGGWEIIDPYYEWSADATAKKAVRRARAVYVHRIHPLANLSGLGI